METPFNEFSKQLQYLMLQNFKTLEELGNTIDLKRSSVHNLKTGNRAPSFEVLLKLARVFDVSLDYLVGWEPGKVPALPEWLMDLLPGLLALDDGGRKAVKALVDGLAKGQDKNSSRARKPRRAPQE
jgi:transcriptional regulator with XRE-family HTH domain